MRLGSDRRFFPQTDSTTRIAHEYCRLIRLPSRPVFPTQWNNDSWQKRRPDSIPKQSKPMSFCTFASQLLSWWLLQGKEFCTKRCRNKHAMVSAVVYMRQNRFGKEVTRSVGSLFGCWLRERKEEGKRRILWTEINWERCCACWNFVIWTLWTETSFHHFRPRFLPLRELGTHRSGRRCKLCSTSS